MIDKVSTALLDFDNCDIEDAAEKILLLSKEPTFSYVVTPNVDHMARLCDSKEGDSLLAVYRQASLILCDSRILEKMLRLLGKKLKAIVPGSDLTKYIFDNVLTEKDTVVVFGGDEININILRGIHKGLTIMHINPSMGFIDKPEEVVYLIDQVAELNPDYLFLAVGSPRQEVFAAKLRESGVVKGVALCIGASINFLVGVEKRSPVVMQALHLEWLYRMLQDPKRLLKRYVMNACALINIYRHLKRK